jgi:spermidine synthase
MQKAVAILIFFASGASGLIYEVSWTRQIGLALGQTADAAAIVLATYMAGMAIGYELGERWKRRIPALTGYAIAEVAVAIWAWIVPSLLSLVHTPLLAGWSQSASPVVQAGIRISFSMLTLLPATIALGTTLPLIAGLALGTPESRGRWICLAYAANTAGALSGTLTATFWLLAQVGVTRSSYLASGISIGCGIVAWVLNYASGSQLVAMSESDAPAAGHSPVERRLLVVAAASGFVTLALEVLYTRLVSLVMHNSSYTFGAVIAVVLLSLAVASLLAGFLSARFSAERLIVACGIAGSLAVIGSVLLFVQRTGFGYFHHGKTFSSYLLGVFGLTAAVVGPPLILTGMVLPLTWRLAHAQRGHVGRLAAINTMFAAAGALSAAFVVRPVLGLWGAFWIVAALPAMLPFAFVDRPLRYALITLAWLLPAGVLVQGAAEVRLEAGLDAGKEIVRRWETAYGWIDVVHDVPNHRWQVRQNLHYSHGASGVSAERERRQGHLPLLLHPHPEQTLFLGLGTGITSSAIRSHPTVRQATLVELIPEVVEAARILSDFNADILSASNVRVVIDDARHFLSASSKRFDVIVGDLYVPWESQTGYLYSVEHFDLVRCRLNQGGLFCQWLPLYQLGPEEFELIANSFASVFPRTTIWWGQIDAKRPILALIGSDDILQVRDDEIAARTARIPALSNGSDAYLASSSGIINLCAGTWEPHPNAPVNTDEHPRVEFSAPVAQGDARLLTGRTFRRWYDEVLSRTAGHEFSASRREPDQLPLSRAWIRELLFGPSRPVSQMSSPGGR